MRVVGIVATFAPLGDGTRGKFVPSSPRVEMGPEHVCRVPLAAVRHGRARQTSESGPCGDCRRVLWVPGPWGQYSGKIRFIEKRGVQDEGFAMLLNVVLTPASLPQSQTSVTGPSASCGYCCPLCPTGGRYRRKIRFIEPQGEMGTGDVCRVLLSAVRHGRARQTLELGPCGDCSRVLWVPGSRGQYSGKTRFIEKHGVQDERGRHVRIVGIVAPFAPLGAGTRVKFVLSSPSGEMSPGDV